MKYKSEFDSKNKRGSKNNLSKGAFGKPKILRNKKGK